MWLVILAFAAAIVTPIWYSKAEEDKYMLKLLCLILWGATIMVLVDHVMGFLMEGGEFFELTAEATVLGFVMLTAALIIWEITLLLKDPKGMLYKKKSK
jgi:peptidoglycan biosynthesis protein MviN/MurJ (putative lipid II flippase)